MQNLISSLIKNHTSTKIIIIFSVFILPLFSYADFSLQNEYEAIGTQSWKDVSVSSDGGTMAAVTFIGDLYMSLDNGLTWYKKRNFGNNILSSVVLSRDGNHLAVSQFNGGIFVSHDRGLSWTESDAPKMPWQELKSSSDGKFIVATTGLQENNDIKKGKIYLSKDYGNSWEVISSSPEKLWFEASISDDGKKIVAVARDRDFIYISNDAGNTWEKNTYAKENSWRSIDMTPDGKTVVASVIKTISFVVGEDSSLTFFVTGKPGYINISRDGGNSWEQLINSGERDWREVAVSDDGKTIVGGTFDGKVVLSVDNGNSWEEFSDQDIPVGFVSLSSNGRNVLFANMDSGFLYVSNNQGVSFNKKIFESPQNWSNTSLSQNGKDIVVAPAYSFMYHSSDGGNSWHSLDSLGINSWTDSAISKSGKYIVVSYFGGAFLSSDGGLSWDAIEELKGKSVSSIDISSDGSKVVASVGVGGVSSDLPENVGYLYTSNDFGNTWKENNLLGQRRWKQIKISDDGNVLVAITHSTKLVDHNGLVFISKDFGSIWQEQKNLGQSSWGESLISMGAGNIFVFSSDTGKLFVSSDKGVNWEEKNSNYSSSASINFDGSLLYQNRGPYIYVSKDKGTSFNKMDEVLPKGSVRYIAISGDGSRLVSLIEYGNIFVYKNSEAEVFEESESLLFLEEALPLPPPVSLILDPSITPSSQQNITITNPIVIPANTLNLNNTVTVPAVSPVTPPTSPVKQNITITNPIVIPANTLNLNNTVTVPAVSPVTPPTSPVKQNITITNPIVFPSIRSVTALTPSIVVSSPKVRTKIAVGTNLNVEFTTNLPGTYKIQAVSIATGQANTLWQTDITDTNGVKTFNKILTLSDFGYGGYKIRVGCSTCEGKPYGVSSNFLFHGVGDTGYSIDSDLNFTLLNSNTTIKERATGEKTITAFFRIRAKAIGDTLEVPTLNGDFYSFNLYVDGNRTRPGEGNIMWGSLIKDSRLSISFSDTTLTKASSGRYLLPSDKDVTIDVTYEADIDNIIPSGKEVKVVLATIRNNNKHFGVNFESIKTISVIDKIKQVAGVLFGVFR